MRARMLVAEQRRADLHLLHAVAMTTWVCRAGRHGGEMAPAFRGNGVIALGWEQVDASLEGLSRDAIARRLQGKPGISPRSIPIVAGMLFNFANVIRQGDAVLTPHTAQREILLGRVTGRYEFRPSSRIVTREGYRHHHCRTVEWEGAYPRSRLSADQLSVIDPPLTLFKVAEGETIARRLRP